MSAHRNQEDYMKLIVAGAGAFGIKHLDALGKIDGVEAAAVLKIDARDYHAFVGTHRL